MTLSHGMSLWKYQPAKLHAAPAGGSVATRIKAAYLDGYGKLAGESFEMGSQLPRPPAKSCGDLGGLDGGLGFFVFLPKLASPKRQAVWHNDASETQQVCLLLSSLAALSG